MGSSMLKGCPSLCSSFLGEAFVIAWSLKKVAWMLRGSSVTIHTDSAGSMYKLTNVDSWAKVTDL